MITDTDIKKMKAVFVTKDDLKALRKKLTDKFATKDEMYSGFRELVKYIGETKSDIMKELNDFRNEMNDFRYEMRDINRNNQSTLNDHESRIAHLEYAKS